MRATNRFTPLRADSYILILVVLLAFTLRTWVLNDLSIYHDEMLRYVRNLHGVPLLQIPLSNELGSVHVAALLMAKASSLLLGENLFAFRWPSIMLSVMGIVLTYRIGSWLLGQKTGLGAAALLAISPMALFYGHMFQGYNGMLCFVLLAYALGIRGLQTTRSLWWWLAAASWTMAVYSHLYSALAAFGMLGLVVIWHLKNRRLANLWLQTLRPPLTATATGVLVGVLLLIGPPLARWLLNLWMGTSFTSGAPYYNPQNPDRVVSVFGLVRDFTSFNDDDNAIWNPLPFYIMTGTAGLTILLAIIQRKWASIAAVLSATVLSYGAYQVIHWLRPDILGRERYFLYMLPFFLMLVAYFPSTTAQMIGARHRFSPHIEKLFSVGTLCLIAAFWIPLLSIFYTTGLAGNWRSVAIYIAERIHPSDLVICERFQHSWDELYWTRVDVCQENLEFWRRAKGLTALYPVLSLSTVTDYNRLSADPRILGRYANSWLVLVDVPEYLEARDPTGNPYPEWRRYGRTVVIPSPPDSRVFDALVFYLDLLRTWSLDPGSQLFHHSRLAHLAIISGDLAGAQKMWERVEQLKSQVPKAEPEVFALRDVLQKPPLLRLPEHPMRFQIGDAIQFEGYTLHPNNAIKRGDTLQLTLFWRALQRPPADYTVFVHVVNAQGEIVFQGDFMPTPHTTGWWPGDPIWEEISLPVPENVPPGEYRVVTGMYLLATMERLPITEGAALDSAILLTTLRVE